MSSRSRKPKMKKVANIKEEAFFDCSSCGFKNQFHFNTIIKSTIETNTNSKNSNLAETECETNKVLEIKETKDTKETKVKELELENGKSTKKLKLVKSSKSNDEIKIDDIFPRIIKIEHKGFWMSDANGKHYAETDKKCSRNSVMLSETCPLYILKLAMRHRAVCHKYLPLVKIDAQNSVPHIVVRKSPADSNNQFDNIQGEEFKIDESSLSLKKQFLIVELDRDRDLHMTMLYNSNLPNDINLKEEFAHVVRLLDQRPDFAKLYSELPYFGIDAAAYWLESADSYPENITQPIDWTPKPIVKPDYSLIKRLVNVNPQ